MNAPRAELPNASVRYPWPSDAEALGPALRVVADDHVWQGALRRFVERSRRAHPSPLALLKFESITYLSASVESPQLLDVVLVDRDGLWELTEWISHRSSSTSTVALLCRNSLVEPDDRSAAEQLLMEAGARAVIPRLRDLGRLDALVSQLPGRGVPIDPLAELPLGCWGPAWQHRP